MNALALLCNLHAEGPTTLHRLRRAGCDTLEDLLDRDVVELCGELEVDAATVERLLREARHLMQRIEGGGLPQRVAEVPELADEASEPMQGAWVRESADEELEVFDEELLDEVLEDEVLDDELDDESEICEEATVDLEPRAPGPIPEPLQPVLATWRALDRSAPPADPERSPSQAASASASLDLEDAGLPGLHPAIAERLAELGIDSLQGLVDAHALELARALPLSYTRVKRFQFLAERVLAELEEPTLTPRPPQPPAPSPEEPRAEGSASAPQDSGAERDAPQGPAEAGPDWVESAGPFA